MRTSVTLSTEFPKRANHKLCFRVVSIMQVLIANAILCKLFLNPALLLIIEKDNIKS